MRLSISWAALALALTIAVTPATGVEFKGVTFDDQLEIGDNTFVVNGMALRKKAFFKVYLAVLYLPEVTHDAEVILSGDMPWHLVMYFERDIDVAKINKAWMDGLERNTPDASDELRASFERMCEQMPDAVDGERYVLTYVPGVGTDITAIGEEIGRFEGASFASAILACFIGPDPAPGDGFKKDLLGLD